MISRDGDSEIMAYGFRAWIAGLVLAAVILGILFGFAHPIS